ncbi:MAG: hypothetical protein HYU39_05440 [Thaumarchaeota archaeon]|nr:hypothetical protein [Nitrososphaerota archaeon]
MVTIGVDSETPRRMRVRSIATYLPASKVRAELLSLGFQQISEATVVSDGKFWKKSIYSSGSESVTVSDEVGTVMHLRDPVITVWGSSKTIRKIASLVGAL